MECDSDAARSCVNDSGSEEDSFAAEEIDEVDNEDDTKSIDDESSAEEGDKEPDDDDPNLVSWVCYCVNILFTIAVTFFYTPYILVRSRCAGGQQSEKSAPLKCGLLH